jgi:hypothetical protein
MGLNELPPTWKYRSNFAEHPRRGILSPHLGPVKKTPPRTGNGFAAYLAAGVRGHYRKHIARSPALAPRTTVSNRPYLKEGTGTPKAI